MPDAEFASRTTSAAASSYEGFTARARVRGRRSNWA